MSVYFSSWGVYLGKAEHIRMQHGDGRSVFLWHYNQGRKKAIQE